VIRGGGSKTTKKAALSLLLKLRNHEKFLLQQ